MDEQQGAGRRALALQDALPDTSSILVDEPLSSDEDTISDDGKCRLVRSEDQQSASIELHHLQSAGGLFKKRTIQSLMMCLGLANVYAMRVNLSVAVEPMKDHYGWSNREQGFVLSSFFWGYVAFQIPGSLLAARFGGKPVFGVGVLGTAVLTLLLPLCADRLWLLYLVRAVMGLFESVSFPAINEMFTHWLPCTERSWHVGAVNCGTFLGTAVAFPVAGAVCGIHKDASGTSTTWPWVFYGFGGVGVAWYVGWQLLTASTPAEHPGITADERRYIEGTTHEDADTNLRKVCVARSPRAPWVGLLTHPAAWAIYVAHFAANFGSYMLLTYLPKYLDEVLGFSVSDAGFVAVLPYILQFAVGLVASDAADTLIRHSSVRTVRLLATIAGSVFAAGFLIAAGWMSDHAWCVTFLTASVALSAVGTPGFTANYVDVSPHRAGAMFAVGNVFANFAGIVAPIIAAAVLGDDSSGSGSSGSGSHPGAGRWRDVFYIAAGVYAFAVIVYVPLMSGKPVAALN